MAEVRTSAGVPAAAAFGGLGAPSPGTPIVVNTVNGDLYVLREDGVVVRVGGGSVTKGKPSDTSKTNTVTLANDPDLFFPILANETWYGRCWIDLSGGITTTGVKFTITAPTGATGNIHCAIVTDATSGNVNPIQNTNTLGAALDFTAGAFPASVSVAFMQVVWNVANGSTAGNITVQWSQSTSSGTALTFGASSQITAQRP